MTRQCPQCNRNRAEKFWSSPRAKVCNTCKKQTSRRSARAAHLWRSFGITLDEYDAMLAAQGGVCAICKKPRPYNLPVDHDHQLERDLIEAGAEPLEAARRSIRGLVCKRENGLLRDVRDDPAILRSAADYIDDPPARRVLEALRS